MSQTKVLTADEARNWLDGAIKQSEIRLKDIETQGSTPWNSQKEQNQLDQCTRLKEIVNDMADAMPGVEFRITADEVVNRGGNPFTSEKVRHSLLRDLEAHEGNNITFDQDGKAVKTEINLDAATAQEQTHSGPTVTPAPTPLPQIEREYTTAQFLPEIRDELKIVTENISENEKFLAKSGPPITDEAAKAAAEKAITNGLTDAIDKERLEIREETRNLAIALDEHERRGRQFSDIDRMNPQNEEFKAHTAEGERLKGATKDLGERLAMNEVNAARLERYLQQPEVQKRIEAYVDKCKENNEVIRDAQSYTAEMKQYRAEIVKVEKTLTNDPKKDRLYKLEAGTDPRNRHQIMKDPTFRQQVNNVQKQIDQTKAKDKGIER